MLSSSVSSAFFIFLSIARSLSLSLPASSLAATPSPLPVLSLRENGVQPPGRDSSLNSSSAGPRRPSC